MFREEHILRSIISILAIILATVSQEAAADVGDNSYKDVNQWALQMDSRHQHEINAMRSRILARIAELNLPTDPTSASGDEYKDLDIRPGW